MYTVVRAVMTAYMFNSMNFISEIIPYQSISTYVELEVLRKVTRSIVLWLYFHTAHFSDRYYNLMKPAYRYKYCSDLGVWCRRVMDWWMVLLTTYTHHSEQVITALLLISILKKSPQHPLNLFFPACCVISRSLATASDSGDSSTSHAQVLFSQPPVQNSTLNWQLTGSVGSSELLYDWRFTANQLVLATSPL
jgi:hypothetical protein